MDGIQPYVAPARGTATGPQTTAADPTHVKTAADYLRAVWRRIWLVLAIGVPLSVLVAIVAVKQRSVYRATAEITIDPPQYDKALSTFLSHDVAAGDSEFIRQYVPNKVALLRSKALAELVLSDPAVSQNTAPGEEAVLELVNNLQVRPVLNSNRFQVSLEGTDPARTKKLLETLLELFQRQARTEIELKNNDTSVNAMSSLNKLNEELKALDRKIIDALTHSTTIGPGGKSLFEERYLMLGNDLLHKRSRMSDFQQQAWMTQMFPHMARGQGNPRAESRLAELEHLRDKYVSQLEEIKRRTRNFNSDPSARHFAVKLAQVLDDIKDLQSAGQGGDVPMVNPAEVMAAQLQREIESSEEKAQALLKELRESMPEHQRYLNWLDERKEKAEQIRMMEEKLSNFEILSRSQKNPVEIPKLIPEPTLPVRPNRVLNIALGVFCSFGLGIGLVCLRERFDHSVKVPEHLSLGLTLPLFGVIPRIRRTAQVHRGGHLWTAGAPDSIEADAYRNLRASLVGTSARHGAIVTLLVTSAKAGEGKSTTALNLAATCARAGERTLLMDVDLRRPSLGGVFRAEDDADEPNVGLADVLRGDLPWQRTVRRTEIPNLDFLPTGDTRDIPIEILGTVELRQLLIGLARHYDRVILDGPATLGLPDCRMLGPFVDAALLVVRSGAHALQPLKRAKAFLEQSNVVLAGVVFNGLYEDLENWSSYGPNTPYGYGYPGIASGPGRAGSLAPPMQEPHAALSVVGSAQA
jgi:capsular exopolysaccharide synthesis family protein